MSKKLDHYYYKAKENGYLARSIFKLEEIDKKYGLLKNRTKPFYVLDLGCAPGSWLQYIVKKLKKTDKVIGIDISKISLKHELIHFINKAIEDVSLDEIKEITAGEKIDLVLSDMAPKTSGIKLLDQENSIELCILALNKAIELLKKNSDMVLKVFEGPEVKNFTKKVQKHFKDVKKFKPDSSKKESYEIFIIAKNFLG